jgi:phosphoribosyl 1,2-cyclic phosphodiesterase
MTPATRAAPDNSTRLVFLGTGASGGTPGRGRSRRHESSLLVEHRDGALLIDATRDFVEQAARIRRLDAVLLTHAHRDASGGILALGTWARRTDRGRVPVLGAPETLSALQRRAARLDHCELVPIQPRTRRQIAGWHIRALLVPHARDTRVPTYAWRLRNDTATIVYASDVAYPTTELQRFARGATVLVVDGATWHRTIFSHLRIDRDLPHLCRWSVEQIFLTQIGRSAPPHPQLEREVSRLCPRARPAYDGLTLKL